MVERAFILLLSTTSFLPGCFASSDDDVNGSDGDDAGDAIEGRAPTRIESYIRGDAYPRLVIEVDSVAGMEPYANTVSRIETGLADVLDKPAGVEVVLDDTLEPHGEDHTWTREALFALADEMFDLDVPNDTTKMHAIFLDGHDENDSDEGSVLGLAWSHRHIVIYKQTIERLCSGILPGLQQQLCENAEASVLTHEVGHVIGLVDLGLPMVEDHKDPDHGPHSDNEDCVMYWAYAGERVVDLLSARIMGGQTAALGFDDACLADIAALRDAP
jgi:hypothetical protein